MIRSIRAAIATVSAVAALALAAPAQAAPFDPKPGSDGVGDPLFPTLGNGGYDVTHYDLSFDFTPLTYDFTGTMKISATATQDLSSFNLDIDSLAVDAVTVNGEDAAWAVSPGKSGQELTVTPAGGLYEHRPFDVAVRYHGNGKTKPIGAPGWRHMSDGGFVSAAQSSRADTFAPVNDTPRDKASWTFHLTAPDSWTPAANGTATGTRPAGEGRTTHDFRLDAPMASELLGISVAKQTLLTGEGPHGVRLRHYVPADQVDTYRPIVEQTGEQIGWLEQTLGVRYPFDTYGMQIVRDGYGDALENQTLSLFGPGWFKNADTSTTYTNVMIHELTHQWFGDSVTPIDWQNAWLNEGPAVYYAALWADQQGTASMEAKMRTAYGKLDAVRKTDGPPGLPTALGGFNIYDGAAVTLYALNQRVGQEEFDALMKSWLLKNRHDNAGSQDFIDNAVRVTHDPTLRPFLEDWLFSTDNPAMPGHPDWS
ncbi:MULTISPECIES: M1 family metallopeptidase [Streptomyces]|uniref:Aminopeptidase N n=1 Tax=Streptomyces solicathayae TaxID=3081768 RepID=A0ABZ0LKJ0_9ACTN|nr:M1 family metallopeptidase [Streptomyces sp. HUAS YS2]WOX20018.1 M1 family metallopeptidase [Streptomyces sp. HUAS YS2]